MKKSKPIGLDFLAPPAGLVQRKQSMIVFSNGVTPSASGQSRACAGDSARHTTVTGENRDSLRDNLYYQIFHAVEN